MSVPYMPLYVADYEADTAHLSPEEDGIYMRLLRLCWRTPGCSIPDDPDWIARMMRVTPSYFAEKVEPIIAEFFKRRKARLFSPRQQREFDRIKSTSEKRSSAGKKGGRPAKPLAQNEKAKSPAKANEKHLELEPELEPERKERENPLTPTDAEFEAVWSAYPKKVGKGGAQKAWAKARRSAPFEAIAGPLREFISLTRGADPQFIPHLATWLNQERWNDDQSHARNGPRSSTEDLRGLATISATDDLARLWGPERKAIAQ